MHVVIAWWDGRPAALPGTARPERYGSPARPAAPGAGDFPGLREGRRLDDSSSGREGLALIWDSAHSADLFFPVISEELFGCAPSHRWAFELEDTPADTPAALWGERGPLASELALLLHA
ncbi:hypothetical protein ACFWNK_23115 [Streptomyces sp. NPDC058417]|uniref:hypothetical protein n=1 Tax=unclassified Streptomyces TaxID=2593676 RepID=UPI00365BB1E9